MSNNEARQIFDNAIASQTDADPAWRSGQIAKLELMREYFTNPAFRKALEDKVAQINGL